MSLESWRNLHLVFIYFINFFFHFSYECHFFIKIIISFAYILVEVISPAPNGIQYNIKVALMTRTPTTHERKEHICKDNIKFLILKKVCLFHRIFFLSSRHFTYGYRIRMSLSVSVDLTTKKSMEVMIGLQL